MPGDPGDLFLVAATSPPAERRPYCAVGRAARAGPSGKADADILGQKPPVGCCRFTDVTSRWSFAHCNLVPCQTISKKHLPGGQIFYWILFLI